MTAVNMTSVDNNGDLYSILHTGLKFLQSTCVTCGRVK